MYTGGLHALLITWAPLYLVVRAKCNTLGRWSEIRNMNTNLINKKHELECFFISS